MESEIYLLDKNIDKIMKKLKEKQNSGTLTTLRKLLEIKLIVPKLNI